MPNKTSDKTKKAYSYKDSTMYKGYNKKVGGSVINGTNLPTPKKTDLKHAPGSYGYALGTSSIKPGPSKKEKKVIDDKYRSKTPSTEERTKQFKNDPNAQNAVDYMTTAKGYQPDPLKARGGSINNTKTTVKKGTGVPVKKLKVKPKF